MCYFDQLHYLQIEYWKLEIEKVFDVALKREIVFFSRKISPSKLVYVLLVQFPFIHCENTCFTEWLLQFQAFIEHIYYGENVITSYPHNSVKHH